MKRSRIFYFITMVLALVILTSCGNIKVSKSSGDYAGMNYQEVSDELSKLGFKNISTEEIADLPSQGETKDGSVESVTIGGEAFEAGGSFSKEAEVHIIYHTIKTLPLPIGADEISGKDYKEIGKLLTDSGFTNVEVKEVKDIDPEGAATDPYNEVTVSGSADFKKGDSVPFDAAISVFYHLPYEIFDTKVHIDFVPNLFFDKYRVEFFVDDESKKVLDHGEDFDGEMRLKAGTHKFNFKNVENASVEGEEDIEITSNSEVNITISCKTDYVEVKVDSIYKESDVGENQIRINFESFDYYGKDHKEVVDELKSMGFTNITEQPLYDIELGITAEGSVDLVSIDGSTDYQKGDIFDKDAAVIVPYHLKAEDDPNKPKETADTSEAAAGETTEKEPEKENDGYSMPVMSGTDVDTATEEAENYGLEKAFDDQDFGHGTKQRQLTSENGGLTMDIIYSTDTKEILCARIITRDNLSSKDEQEELIVTMSGTLCPEKDKDEVTEWVSSNVGEAANTTIGDFVYETALGPTGNYLYNAGMFNWEEWIAAVE